jgi:hypothetical protein
MDERERAADLGSCSAPSQPVRAAGDVSIHARIAWTTRTSDSLVMTASPPGRNSRASAAISRKTACIHVARAVSDASTWIVAGRMPTRLRAAGWSKCTAPQTRMVGGPPLPRRRIS